MSVTIAIPFFNAEKYISQTIQSVLAQSYTDWELLLVDDGSQDASLSIAKSYEGEKIRVISDGLNKGLASRLNQIVVEAKYELIARMDADDLMCPKRIEKQVQFLNSNPNIDLVTTGVCSLDENNRVIGVRIVKNNHVINNIEQVYSGGHGIVHASILARKSWHQRNMYSENLKRAQDFDLWLRAFSKNDLKVGYLSYPGYYYRENFSVDKEKLIRNYKTGYDIIELNSLYLNNVFFKRIALFLKILAVNLFFDYGLNKLLLKRRSSAEVEGKYIKKFNNDLDIINSFSIVNDETKLK